MNFSKQFEPYHVFSEPGTYMIKLILYHEGNIYKSTSEVIILPLPELYLGDDQIVYPGAHFTLDAGDEHITYKWHDGSTGQTYLVTEEGTYSVIVTNEFGCDTKDAINVYYLEFAVPNAFTPNGDGINDKFKPVMPQVGIREFSMVIFNRKGTKVFETNKKEDGWDGTFNGKDTPVGSYVWLINFDAQVELIGTKSVEKKGIVTLLR
jgi:gliding motility-associated-like protein